MLHIKYLNCKPCFHTGLYTFVSNQLTPQGHGGPLNDAIHQYPDSRLCGSEEEDSEFSLLKYIFLAPATKRTI